MRSYFRQIRNFSKEEQFELKSEGQEGPARRNSKCQGPAVEREKTGIVWLEPNEPG